MEEEIENVLKEEMTKDSLVELPKDFYIRVGSLLRSLDREIERKSGLERKMLEEKKKYLLKKIEHLINLRLKKCLVSLLNGRAEQVHEDEKTFIEEISQVMRRMREKLLTEMTPREGRMELVFFLSKLPKIVGEDMKFYGPFVRGSVASIPKRTADLLVKKGVARKIEVEL